MVLLCDIFQHLIHKKRMMLPGNRKIFPVFQRNLPVCVLGQVIWIYKKAAVAFNKAGTCLLFQIFHFSIIVDYAMLRMKVNFPVPNLAVIDVAKLDRFAP